MEWQGMGRYVMQHGPDDARAETIYAELIQVLSIGDPKFEAFRNLSQDDYSYFASLTRSLVIYRY
jgi:hypothetical protein